MDTKVQTFKDFLTTQSVQIEVTEFAINIIIAALLGFLLSRIYIRFGSTLSNRTRFSSNFVLITMTTMTIITIVKSSLALSLGLVGALSIVRFRAAIKDPEELSYLFLTICIGLGLGADQRKITLVMFAIIVTVIVITKRSALYTPPENLHVRILRHGEAKFELQMIVDILNANCLSVKLKRLDESKDIFEASFFVELKDFSYLKKVNDDIHNLDDAFHVTFLDTKGIA